MKTVLLAFAVFLANVMAAQTQHTIEGIILSRSDSAAVAFASVYVDVHTGTIANENGYFKLSSKQPIRNFTITHVNYESSVVTTDQVFPTGKIFLNEKSFRLHEVTVSGNTAETEIRLAVKKSSRAILLPVIVEGYYSEFVKTNGVYEKFADGMIRYYIPKGYKDEKSIDAKVIASRAVDLKPDDDGTLDMASPVGVRFALRHYDISRVKKFLDSLSFEDYQYSILSGDDVGEKTVVIDFSPKADRQKMLYKGTVHIDKEKNLIRYLDYKIAEETVPYSREVNAVLIKVKLMSARGTFLFDERDGQYMPVYVREMFELRMFNKKIDQTTAFTQQFQLLEAKASSQTPFKRSEEYSKKALYHNGTHFTDRFWENANLVQATKEEGEIVSKVSDQ